MTDPTTPTDDALRRRVEELRRRRGAPAPAAPPAASTGSDAPRVEPTAAVAAGRSRRGRRHPAKAARVGAAGVGFASMFGLVAVMGLANRSAEVPTVELVTAPSPAVSTTAPAPVIVVVHPAEPPPATGLDAPAAAVAAAAAPVAPVAPGAQAVTAPAPIELSAPPVVRPAPAPVAPVPTPVTRGSN